MNGRWLRFVRFCAVGALCFALGLAILASLHELAGVNYLVAYVVSFVVTNVVGYLLNARFTFALRSVAHTGVIRYMTVNAILLGANTLAMMLLVERMRLWYLFAAVCVALVNTPLSFAGQWLFTYRAQVRARAAAV